jgi:hypothetical protein
MPTAAPRPKSLFNFPDAVMRAKSMATMPASIEEIARERILADPSRTWYEWSRTAAVYFQKGDGFYVAFDDMPSQTNVLLYLVEQWSRERSPSFSQFCSRELSYRSQSYTHALEAIARAEHTDRVIPVPTSGRYAFYQTLGSSRHTRAMLGSVAPEYEKFTQRTGQNIWLVPPYELEKVLFGAQFHVLPVMLSGELDDGDLDASRHPDFKATMRGIRR